MAVKLRSAVGIAMIWVATVAGVSATAWVAIDRAGRDITGADVTSLRSLAATAAASTAPGATSATASPSASPSPSTSAGSATQQDDSVRVAGGQVSVRCTGATVGLRSAQPDNGWRVEVGTSGPREVVVSFESGEDETERGSQVTAVCASGKPVFKVTNHS